MSIKKIKTKKKTINSSKTNTKKSAIDEQNGKTVNKLYEFFYRHPTLIRIMDQIDDVYNKFMIGYFIFAAILVAIPVIIAYYSLTEEIRGQISALLGTVLSVIIIPTVLNAYNRKKDNEYNRFEINKDLYFELTDILLPILLNGSCTDVNTVRIKDYILSHYNVMCISFSSSLFSNICSIYKGCECDSYKNVEYYAEKIIKQIRRECGNNKDFRLSLLVIKLNKENDGRID